MKKYLSGEIRIIKIPDGEAPLWVQEEWVGLILPVAAISDGKCHGVISNRDVECRERYWVHAITAIKLLQQKSMHAAKWWQDNCTLRFDDFLVFEMNEAEPVESLTEVQPEMWRFIDSHESGSMRFRNN